VSSGSVLKRSLSARWMQVKLLFVTFNLNLSENLLTDVKFLDDSVILKANPNRFLVFDTPLHNGPTPYP